MQKPNKKKELLKVFGSKYPEWQDRTEQVHIYSDYTHDIIPVQIVYTIQEETPSVAQQLKRNNFVAIIMPCHTFSFACAYVRVCESVCLLSMYE